MKKESVLAKEECLHERKKMEDNEDLVGSAKFEEENTKVKLVFQRGSCDSNIWKTTLLLWKLLKCPHEF